MFTVYPKDCRLTQISEHLYYSTVLQSWGGDWQQRLELLSRLGPSVLLGRQKCAWLTDTCLSRAACWEICSWITELRVTLPALESDKQSCLDSYLFICRHLLASVGLLTLHACFVYFSFNWFVNGKLTFYSKQLSQ